MRKAGRPSQVIGRSGTSGSLIRTSASAGTKHICPKGEPCPCGHSPVFCHRLNAARYCPQDERLAACEAERDRYREALEQIASHDQSLDFDDMGVGCARAALNPEDDDDE